MLKVEHLERLSEDKALALAAAKASLQVMESYNTRFSYDRWQHQAIVARQGDVVVGFLQFDVDKDTHVATISLAWVSPDCPKALAALLLAARRMLREKKLKGLDFCHHMANFNMHRLAGIVGALPKTISYEMEFNA